ncbi:MAG: AAA family ATPase [Brooklawnia sp.]|uniref:ATP-binding protein n=1 Tax=Brooklawnia sp. TaxID=2699740 RepID=UPI003C7887E5
MTEQITDSIDDAMTPDQSYWDSLLAEDPVPTFDTEVQRRAYRLRVDRAAHDLLDAENRPTPEPLDVATLADVLTRPAPTADRIEGLAPWEGSTLITAMRKTGKTTMAGNLARCLITGAPFLGRFEVKPLNGTLAFLNYEVSGHQLARWLDEMGVDQDRVLLANLRGRANPLTHPDARGELSERLKVAGVEAIIVDPFGRAFTGDDQNNAGQVTKFLMDLETFVRSEVGARDLFLTNHAGWDAERSRGSTALEDWPDALWRIVRDQNRDDSSRYFSAFGRDVEVSEDQLSFDPDTRRLSLTGTGSRRQASAARKNDELANACVRIVELMPGINGSSLEQRLKTEGFSFQRGAGVKAAKCAVEAGLLRIESGSNNQKRFFSNQPSQAFPSLPTGNAPSYPNPSYRRGIAGRTAEEPSYPDQTGDDS